MDRLNEYYEQYREDTRLTQDNIHRSEFLTTMHLLKRHLPPGARILDCCAGTGIYAFALADMGHCVTAGDLVEKHVEIMRRSEGAARLDDIYQGDVLDLSRFQDDAFDVVLCLGAFYHLQTGEEQERAVDECLRTLRRGGLFIFSYMNPFVLYYRQLARAVRQRNARERIEAFRQLSCIERTGRDGMFRGMLAREAEALVERNQLELVVNANAYGTLYPLYPELNSFTEEEFEEYLSVLLATCDDPDVAAHSMHGLCIAKK